MKKIKSNIYFKYSITFLILFVIGLLPIEIKNQSFLFSGLFVDHENFDGLTQHILFMNDYISQIKEWIFSKGPFPIYRFDIGLGADFFTSYTYYSLFDPLLIIAYIIPLQYIEISYYLLIMIRLYLSGLFMILLARNMGIKTNKALLAVGIFYCFNSTVIYSAFRHPMFTNGPMLFPLLILGSIKILRKERPYLLIFTTCYALLSQFYIFVYLAFGFELFVIIKTLFNQEKKERVKIFLKLNLIFLLGSLLAGFVLLPQIYATLFGGRISSKGFVWYASENYFLQLITYLVPLTGPRYSSSIGSFFIFFICILHLSSNNKKWYSYYFMIISILYGISLFGYIINGFSYVNNRWMFLIILPSALMLGDILDSRITLKEKVYQNSAKIFIVFMLAIVFFGVLYGVSSLNVHLVVKVLLYLAIVGGVIYLIYKLFKVDFTNINLHWLTPNIIFKGTLISSLVSLIAISSYYLFFLTPADGFSKYYSDPDTFETLRPINDFHRVEFNKFEANMQYFANDTIFYKLPSSSEYNTMTNGYINNFFSNLKIVNSNNSVGYNGFDGRARLLALNNVKYYVIRESENRPVPYGFEYFTSIDVKKYDNDKRVYDRETNLSVVNGQVETEKANIYENKNFIGLGNVFYNIMLEEEFNQLTSLEKELLLLDTLIVSEEINLPKRTIHPEVEKQQPNNLVTNNLEIKDNQIIVNGKQGSIKFKVNNNFNSELFVEMVGLRSIDKYHTFSVYYQTNAISTRQKIYAYGRNMYTENSTHLVNLGYYPDQDVIDVEIVFEKGIYYFDDINYYQLSTADIDQKILKLANNSLTNLEILPNGFQGQITTTEDGALFVSLPYSNGFKAYINGKEVTVIRANIGYMAINLPKGNNYIEFVYTTPGLNIGLIISLFSIFSVIILVTIIEITKKEEDSKGKVAT